MSVSTIPSRGLWEPTARFIARQFPDPANPPVAGAIAPALEPTSPIRGRRQRPGEPRRFRATRFTSRPWAQGRGREVSFGRDFVDGWNRFFFAPIPRQFAGPVPDRVCLRRAGDGRLSRRGRFGLVRRRRGLAVDRRPEDVVRIALNLLALLPHSDAAVYCLFAALLLAAAMLLVGFRTRLASVVLWACLVSLHHRNVFPLNAGDHLMRTLSFFLMFAPSGRAYSVDRLLRLRRGVEQPGVVWIEPWPQRLLQIQVCVCISTRSCSSWRERIGSTAPRSITSPNSTSSSGFRFPSSSMRSGFPVRDVGCLVRRIRDGHADLGFGR